jgi:hypothetical protein
MGSEDAGAVSAPSGGRASPIPSWRASPPPLGTRLGWLGIASAGLDLGAVYIKSPVLRPGVTWGDLIDIATPVVLVLLYAIVLRALRVIPTDAAPKPARPGPGPRLLVTMGGFGLILGHGIHVAANSIHDAITRAGTPDPLGLANWWDEHLSHFTIHGSKAAICVGLSALESRAGGASSNSATGAGSGLFTAGVAAYGFITFAEGVEGQTVSLVLPFCLAYLAWSLGKGPPLPAGAALLYPGRSRFHPALCRLGDLAPRISRIQHRRPHPLEPRNQGVPR